MASQNSAATAHTFQAHDGDTLLSEVTSVRCILLPGSLTVAGYGAEGQVLIIRHTNDVYAGGNWLPQFFENQFLSDPLLAMPRQVRTVFVGSPHQLMVPDALYDETESGKWLQSLYHLHPEDSVLASVAKGEEAHYLLSMPVKMQALLHKYFTEANVLPLAAYQLNNASEPGNVLRCLLTADQVMATFYHNRKLLWHQVFAYASVEDIAWQFAMLCKEHSIAQVDLKLEVTTLSDATYDVVLELETFFPKIRWSAPGGLINGHWSPVVYLLQQLYQCAL